MAFVADTVSKESPPWPVKYSIDSGCKFRLFNDSNDSLLVAVLLHTKDDPFGFLLDANEYWCLLSLTCCKSLMIKFWLVKMFYIHFYCQIYINMYSIKALNDRKKKSKHFELDLNKIEQDKWLTCFYRIQRSSLSELLILKFCQLSRKRFYSTRIWFFSKLIW